MTVDDHKCLACGADLAFEPKSQKWICEYCGESYSLKDLENHKKNTISQKNLEFTTTNNYNEYHCKNCGAQIVMDENTSVTECVYCGSTAIITNRLTGELAPQQLIPFKTTKDDALKAFSDYKKGKWFMPEELMKRRAVRNYLTISCAIKRKIRTI